MSHVSTITSDAIAACSVRSPTRNDRLPLQHARLEPTLIRRYGAGRSVREPMKRLGSLHLVEGVNTRAKPAAQAVPGSAAGGANNPARLSYST